jgi:hypothetical protein
MLFRNLVHIGSITLNKSTLFSTIAFLPLIASGAFAGTSNVLWDQNSSDGGGYALSENGTAAADDFTVPPGQTWLVKEVDVTGVYFNGSGPASSEIVTFYADKKGKPGRIKQGPFTLKCTDNFGSFKCALPQRVKLGAGTWWVSLVANIDFSQGGEWGWGGRSTVQGNEAVWEDPGGQTCPTWEPMHVCFGGSPSDLAFKLLGRANESN